MVCWRNGVRVTMLVLSTLAGSQVAQAESIGQIKTLAGEVYLLRAGIKAQAKVGDVLEPTDALLTGLDGRVGVTFVDDSRFSVGPKSHITLEKFTFNPTTQEGDFHTKLERGTLAVISGNIAHTSPEAMKVKTRTSILGVRGTHFLVKVDH